MRFATAAMVALILAGALAGLVGCPSASSGGLLEQTGSLNGYVYVPASRRSIGAAAITGSAHAAQGNAAVISPTPLTDAEQEAQGLVPAVGAILRTDRGQYAATNSFASFSMLGVPAGNRSLSVDAEGQVDTVTAPVVAGMTTSGTQDPTTPVDPGLPGAVTGYVFRANNPRESGSLFSFTPVPLIDPNRVPAEGVVVSTDTGQQTTTNPDGAFDLFPVPPGSHVVSVSEGTEAEHSVSVEVSPGRTVFAQEAFDPNLGSIQGYVVENTDPEAIQAGQNIDIVPNIGDQTPVVGAVVATDTGQIVFTRDDGSFQIFGVPRGIRIVAALTEGTSPAFHQALVEDRQVSRAGEIPPQTVDHVDISAPADASELAVGDVVLLSGRAFGADQQLLLSIFRFDWISSNAAVGTVNRFGFFRAVAPGTTTITASVGGVTASREMTVSQTGPSGRLPGRIAFDNGEDIFAMDAAGTNPRRITRGEFISAESSDWSPNGTLILFEARSTILGLADLWVIGADGSALRNLTNTTTVDEHAPRWSPDGSQIAFDDGNDLFVMNADGTGVTNLTQTPEIVEVASAWEPDGGHLVFTQINILGPLGLAARGLRLEDGKTVHIRPALPDTELRVYDIVEQFAAPIALTGVTTPAFAAVSPDGTTLVFEDLSTGDLYTAPIAGGAASPLTSTLNLFEFAAQWSPDGSHIVFSQFDPQTEDVDILAMANDGTGLVNLTNTAQYSEVFPDWAE